MIQAYLSRFDLWQFLLTLVPLVAGVAGGMIAARWTQHLGKVVIAYSAICIGVGLAPQWLPAAGLVPDGPLRPVLVETKLFFIVGILTILAAAGRAIQRRSRAAASPVTR
ncbi:MAG: hypothetical protein KJZ74_03505 [Gemmatimonadales bacterium]|nr:hypothetical protein [Gemmatimonadota bacterium]MCL4212961.1 hypothetical protein [Gemmatimonadales bacterium]